ncbi:DNA mismatch repair endonuclease MutL [Sulfuriflexus sp.]|uniref:DNA mismatch repair endonuclease MutL n=1 Tax=Sulfuriflexus sp. TaxID=2015443 RepID=UPI0028CEDA98|nr:DNA mismatch repair endonuclease MutL [Sulfuriflexus sp.]MDT8404892.1 DNA mismatch repair endonuclease MutL [Sulfuriflexus sp.]
MSDILQRRINQLPVQLANQIAAGEVVERPASVVKELLENSLDAGATRIDIEIERGGLQQIRIVDNGHGIHPADLPLALSRHATSKLLTLEELASIASLGFRGEALPSIASVSRLQLISRQAGAEQGTCIEVDANGKSSVRPAAHPQGTSVIVEELFCNAPARRRFMRAAKTEFTHVQDVVQRIALGAPHVAINLRHNDRQVLRLPAAKDEALQQRRLAQVFGQGFTAAALPAVGESDGIRVSGFVAPASQHRSQADHQYVYINGRMIRDRLVNHAIRQAYADTLPAGRYASYVLMLELEPDRVDVNVHPTKHEVRFRDARLVHDFLFSVVKHALHGQNDAVMLPATGAVQERASLYLASSNQVVTGSAGTAGRPTGERRLLFGEPLQLLHRRYLLCQDARQLWLLDARALLTQVNKQRLTEALAAGELKSRPLLLPQRLELDAKRQAQLISMLPRLNRFGFDLSEIDDSHILLRAAPLLLQTSAPDVLLYTAIEHLHADDESLLGALAETAAKASPLSASGASLREWLAIQFNLLGDISKNVPWARALDAQTLQDWLEHK